MAELEVTIDLTEAGLDLAPEELEAYAYNLAAEMKDGLVEDAALVRAAETPAGSKPGQAGFDLGILKAEVNFANFKKLLDWLGDRFYGKTIVLKYGDVQLEYRTDEQLQQQLQALERISELKVRILDKAEK